jgi:polyphosphate kinase
VRCKKRTGTEWGPQYDGRIDDPALYFNRELSWLDFNPRVLELAEDPDAPLLEQVRFCAIYASNLDEFFMVRVAGLFDQVDAGIDARGPDGLGPGEQIDAIQARVLELDGRLQRCFEGALPWKSTGSASSRSTRRRSPSAARSTPASTSRSSRR